jgi:deoxyribodipyrimidine photo-lyase
VWDPTDGLPGLTVGELETDGYLVNQTRMWLASHWAVREGVDWRAGEDRFFRHLLDGSRAANRAGWQWTVGTATGKPYGFSRWQVEKRAPGCATPARCSPLPDRGLARGPAADRPRPSTRAAPRPRPGRDRRTVATTPRSTATPRWCG